MPWWRNMRRGPSTSSPESSQISAQGYHVGEAGPQGHLALEPAAVIEHGGCHTAETRQDVYLIQVGNNKMVERDHTQLLPREPDPSGRLRYL